MAVAMSVQSIFCSKESGELGSDEPYVIATAVDLGGITPAVEATVYGPWSSVDTGERHGTVERPAGMPNAVWTLMSLGKVTRARFWDTNGNPKTLSSPQGAILVLSVMEHDDGNPGAARELAKLAAVGSVAASFGAPFASRVSKVVKDVNDALGTPTGAPNFDDRIQTQALTLDASDLTGAPGTRRTKDLAFAGDNTKYVVRIQFDFT